MSAELSHTLALHGRILGDLDLQEAALKEREVEARKLFEQTLQKCAAEKELIKQHRALLEQAESVYRQFSGTRGGGSSAAGPQASQALVATAVPAESVLMLTNEHAVGDEPKALETATIIPLPQPPAARAATEIDVAVEPDVASAINSLRNELAKGYKTNPPPTDEAGGSRRWPSIWKS